jgi:hypothetical protein
MKFKLILNILFLFTVLTAFGQKSNFKKFKKLSCPEKCWVFWHPFVAKKAMEISEYSREITQEVKQEKQLEGEGNGDQLDAFRHTFWMANLTQQIGWRKARKLGEAHEKGNYKEYKKRKLEDGVLPDKISSEMDLFNNEVGIELGKKNTESILKTLVIEAVLLGKCRMIKKDTIGNYLDCENNIIPVESLKGKWENEKCLTSSNKL